MTEPVMCNAFNDHIDNGAPCIYLKGHEAADMPHVTANGFWWY